MIKPTIGRIVWFWSSWTDRSNPAKQPNAAIVTFVNTDHMVNLWVFGGSATQAPGVKDSVALYQGNEGESTPNGAFCEWMPYQRAQQAQKTADGPDPGRHSDAGGSGLD